MGNTSKHQLLILGGGLIGLSIAYELSRKGHNVEVLSKKRGEAAGFVAAGMLAPHAEGLKSDLLNLAKLSLLEIPNWIKTIEANSGISCGLIKSGIIVPFLNKENMCKYPTSKFGKKLSNIELKNEIPDIGSKWKSGLLFPEDGQIDNRRQLMRALEKACVESGVHFQEGVKVLKIISTKDRFEGVLIKNAEGAVTTIKAEHGVLCCGAWSKQLLPYLPIYPVKGQMFSIQGPKDYLKRILFGPGIYMVPREDGLIIVGATSEKEAVFKTGLTPSGQRQLQEGMNALLPSTKSWPHMERWWGFRPATPDENPILGKSPIKGLFLASGHYRNGVLLAAITAQLITKLVSQEKLSNKEKDLLLKFNWDRF